MSERPMARPIVSRTFGLRVASWYATLFVASTVSLAGVTYALTAASLEQRDRQVLQGKLGEYAVVYARGGLGALTETVRVEQRTAPERLFVRVIDRGTEAVVLSDVDAWNPSHLEIASARLGGDTLVEVGKSSEAREEILSRFRTTLGGATLLMVAVALTGGWLATRTATQPIRRLIDAVSRITETGRTDARVPLEGTGDAIDELTSLFNSMLDRIEGLVEGMRHALDNVSHDLRTPLTHLRGAAETALAADPDVERAREALADCVEETDRVLVMLNTLMDISEAESGAMQLHREPLRLSDAVERAVELYRDVAEARGISLSASCDEAQVSGDRTRLEQVAANLIDNAIKYTPDGGRVDVTVRREPTVAVLQVRDTGTGIAPADLPRIWDRLFRGDISRSARGLGLGLSLVKAVVEAHGGRVGVESEPGRGSTFTVSLPA